VAIAFDYQLTGAGWASCAIRIDDREPVELRAGYLTDALGDLSGAVLAILRGEQPVEFTWQAEPAVFWWRFDRDGWDVRMRIRLWRDSDVLLDGVAEADDLGREMLRVLDAVFDEWGSAGYRERWIDHGFPEAQRDGIRKILAQTT
jgi:hypothetical protein